MTYRLLFFTLFFTQLTFAQTTEKPKLIVGIVVDQMRMEYLYRFQDNYTENGFKKLIRNGYNLKNTHYNYVPTATGPGHASIYTGTTPADHGIISNSWYSRALKRVQYCVEDNSVFDIDNLVAPQKEGEKSTSKSPQKLMTTTITDELKLFTSGRSKVIGLSIKDRASVLPAGHLADAAYWYNSKNGHFITSSYYREKLPNWMISFNNRNVADSLLNTTWQTLLPISSYTNSTKDDAPQEKIYKGRKTSTFPYDLKTLRNKNGNFSLISEIPQGNSLLLAAVKAAIKGEELGRGRETDFLAISFSSTDYLGHNFGIRSKELEDNYVRLDREIESLIATLDEQVGAGNYMVFLTADHAASDNPLFLESQRLPGKFFGTKEIKSNINKHLSELFGQNEYISNIDNTQIYLAETEVSKELLIEKIIPLLKKTAGVKEVFAPAFPQMNLSNSKLNTFIRNSFNEKGSGDILYQMESGWMYERPYGASHSTAYNNDTHVPMLWYGWKIPKGESVKPHTITQIAPTISMLLNIPLPSSSERNPIEELFE